MGTKETIWHGLIFNFGVKNLLHTANSGGMLVMVHPVPVDHDVTGL
jgi:hypothetical protein